MVTFILNHHEDNLLTCVDKIHGAFHFRVSGLGITWHPNKQLQMSDFSLLLEMCKKKICAILYINNIINILHFSMYPMDFLKINKQVILKLCK